MAVISGSVTKSGIVSLPGKVLRARFDQNVQATPAITRTGDQDYSAEFVTPFDDTDALLFTSQTIVAGTGLPVGNSLIERLVATPNTAPTLQIAQPVEVSVLDNRSMYLNPDVQTFKGFNDSRIHVEAGVSGSSFYAVGTHEDVLPGFDSPLSSKVQIVVDLPNSSDRVLGRNTAARSDAQDASGEFAGQNLTGFVYYNFTLGRWEQIGLTDPATGNSIHYDYAAEIKDYGSDSVNYLISSGSNNYPMQFKPPQNQLSAGNKANAATNGLQKTGCPTIACLAPFKTIYHATSSQTLSMKSLINHPFLLEKAVLEFPFTARHRYNGEADTHGWALDNYTFFVYRQVAAKDQFGSRDSASVVTGSNRFLVCSSSLCIFNSTGKTLNPTGNFTGFSPTHTPAQSFDLGVDAATSLLTTIASVTGTMRLEIVPAVTPAQDLAFHGVPSTKFVNSIPQAIFSHVWPGGTSVKPFFELASGYTGKDGVSASYAITASAGHSFNPRTFQQFPESRSLQTFFGNLPIQSFEGRTTKTVGGVNSTFSAGVNVLTTDVAGVNSVVSPYLLLPDDELVFGFDAGIGQPIRQENERFTILTSSFATLKAGTGKLTLFGSLLQDSKEYFPTTNQPLTTVEIQETLHYDNPVLDQFDVNQFEMFSGSNQEETIGGGYGITAWDNQFSGGVSGDRRVIGTRNRGTLGTTGSLQRFDRIPSENEIFVDDRKKNSAVFRYNHFGHIRDMIEPALDGTFRGDPRQKNAGLVSPPIFVKFMRDGAQTDPANTFSQNLSTFATSSLVYVDNPASTLKNPLPGQDRLDNPDETINEELEID